MHFDQFWKFLLHYISINLLYFLFFNSQRAKKKKFKFLNYFFITYICATAYVINYDDYRIFGNRVFADNRVTLYTDTTHAFIGEYTCKVEKPHDVFSWREKLVDWSSQIGPADEPLLPRCRKGKKTKWVLDRLA